MKIWFVPAAAALTAEDPNDLGGYVQEGELTTDHAASSYGQLVIVGEDGTAYGSAEVVAWSGDGGAARDHELERAAAAAGYVRERNQGETADHY